MRIRKRPEHNSVNHGMDKDRQLHINHG